MTLNERSTTCGLIAATLKHLQMAASIYLPGLYQPGEKFTCTWFLIHLIYVRSKKKNAFLQIQNQICYDF